MGIDEVICSFSSCKRTIRNRKGYFGTISKVKTPGRTDGYEDY